MQKRDVVNAVLSGQPAPHVPWSIGFTQEARERLLRHCGVPDVDVFVQNHFLRLGSDIGFFDALADDHV